ncbi:MAG: energy-coupling factor transporter ATPase [Clostridia bacterium]|nr:energy-coupling factor transporter ATPase [Clostridia bacterium]
MRIVAEELNYVYSEKSKKLAVHALNGVNLTIEAGDFFGIIGKTGSGKSTFVQHLNGLIPTDSKHGKLTVGEFVLSNKKCDYKALRAKVGMVFQYPEYQLFAETVFEDVEFGLKSFYPNLTKEEKEVMVKTAIETVGLNYEEIKDKSPFDLSGGQKRRVAIAGVIVSKPEILVLDEPVAGLDPQGKKEFISLLHTLHKTTVKTIIIVSHDMNLVAENCNKIAVFCDGKVAKVGTPKEVFTDYENIKKTGLDLPLIAFLTQKLQEKGIEISTNLTLENFIKEVFKKHEEVKAKQREGGNR